MKIPESLLSQFCDFAGVHGLRKSPYPLEKYRGQYKDSWVVFEQYRENWMEVFCARSDYREEFQDLIKEFNALVNSFLEEDSEESNGAQKPAKNEENT